jgi:hypothetical protein
VGSKTFDGVRFAAYTDDHPPPHVHGSYAGVEVILELLIVARAIRLADRKDRVKPANAKRSDISHVVTLAAEHFDELVQLWEDAQ